MDLVEGDGSLVKVEGLLAKEEDIIVPVASGRDVCCVHFFPSLDQTSVLLPTGSRNLLRMTILFAFTALLVEVRRYT